MKKFLQFLALVLFPALGYSQCTTNNATSCACQDGTTNCDLLPDIHVARPPLLVNGSSGYIEYPQTCNPPCNGNDGRLRLSVSTPNVGFGPLEIRALNTIICGTDTFINPPSGFTCPNGDPLKQLVVQRVYHKTNNTMSYYDRPAGSMTYHPSHGHMHVDDWGVYSLRTQTSDPNPLNWPIVATGAKLAFCLMDYGSCSTYNGHCRDTNNNVLTNGNFPNYGLGGGSYGCSPSVQGISSGYTDIYYQSLDGMWINLPPGLCNGQYWMVVQLDPYNYFLESNENNNVLAVSVNLTQQGGTAPTITANGPTTFCQGGSVTLTASSALSYLWSNGATTQSITVSQPGSYSVTVGSSGSCSSTSAPVTVTVNPVTVNATATPAVICPGDIVQLSATSSASGTTIQPVSFTNSSVVNIPDNNATGAATTINVNGLSPLTLNSNSILSVQVNITHTYVGDLEVRLTSPSGNTILLSNNRGGSGNNFNNTIFSMSAAQMISQGSAPFSGSYRPDAAFSALTGNLNGTWTLRVVDQANTDIGTLNSWTLTLNREVAGTPAFAWTSIPAGFNSSLQNTNASPTVNTSYIVTVTESGTGCTGKDTVTVNVGGNLNVTASTVNAVCAGDSALITASGATTYSWSPSTGLNSVNGASVKASPSVTTTYMVIGSNGSGCTDTAYVTVNVNPLPQVNLTQSQSICAGESLPLSASGASTYSWSPATGLNSTTGNNVTASPSSTITYTVTGTSNGCSSTSSVTVTVNPIPVINTAANVNVCAGQSTVLTASGATTYSWSPATGLSSTTGNNVTATPLTGTTYTVTGTTGNCSNSAQVTLHIITTPTSPSAVNGSLDNCLPLNTVLNINNIADATSYTWSVPAGVNITGQGSNSVTLTGTTSINRLPVCVTADNLCGSSVAKCADLIVFASPPGGPSAITGSPIACPGDILTYSITPQAKATYYQWTIPANTTIVSGAGSASIDLQVLPGFVNGAVNVNSGNGCGLSVIRTKNIKSRVPATPSAISGQNTGICGSTVTYSVPAVAGVNYNWVVPANASIISGQGTAAVSISFSPSFTNGNVEVNAYNNCGNSGVRSRNIKTNLVQPSAINGPVTVCTGQSAVQYSIAPVAGATSYLWTAFGGATIVSGQGTNTISIDFGPNPRTSSINVKASNSCTTSPSKSLTYTSSNCPKLAGFEEESTNSLNLYPNPANSYTEVKYKTEIQGDAQLKVLNILGQTQSVQTVKTTAGMNSYMINLKSLKSGVYLVSIDQAGSTFTRRLIVE